MILLCCLDFVLKVTSQLSSTSQYRKSLNESKYIFSARYLDRFNSAFSNCIIWYFSLSFDILEFKFVLGSDNEKEIVKCIIHCSLKEP